VAAQPVGGLVEAGQLAELDRVEVRQPAVDLAVVEAVGLAEPLEPPRLPVDAGQPGRMPSTSWIPSPYRASRSVSKGAGQPSVFMGDQPSITLIR
jgi:hypothetical protein